MEQNLCNKLSKFQNFKLSNFTLTYFDLLKIITAKNENVGQTYLRITQG